MKQDFNRQKICPWLKRNQLQIPVRQCNETGEKDNRRFRIAVLFERERKKALITDQQPLAYVIYTAIQHGRRVIV